MNIERYVWKYIKRKLKIRSKSALEAQIRTGFGKIFYREKYGTDKIILLMKQLGLKKGATIMLHSSWDEFYNYSGKPQNLINAIIEEIGEDGNLLMPAYPLDVSENKIIDIKRAPTGAGLIAEIFRRAPNVKRSINVHSVCSIGPLSSYLLDEHQYSITCWDEKSPYFKIIELNALIFCFGLGKSFLPTSYHCIESLLREQSPYFKQFFTRIVRNKFRLEDSSIIEVENLTSSPDFLRIATKHSTNKLVKKYFDKTRYVRTRLSNLTVSMYEAKYLVDKMLELGKKGKTVYVRPKPV